MGPLTRSKAVNASSTRDVFTNVDDDQSDNVSDSQDGPSHGIALHLTKALKDARRLQRELIFLRRRNEELEGKLESVEQAVDVSLQPRRGRKAGPTVASLQTEVKKLKSRIHKLEKAKEKDRKKIDKLRMREIKAEAGELEEDAEFEEVDSAYQMRKLLRRFHDLIVATSLDEGEECPICMEKLEPDKCNSLPCEHTFCADCTRQLSPDSEKIKCPQCRTECSREDIEVVEYTASQQWDALLDVAKNWAKVDHRREEDTSDEEAEEEFIDDGHESSTTAPDTVPENPLESSPEPQVAPEELELQNVPEPSPRKRRIAITPESSPEPEPELNTHSADTAPQEPLNKPPDDASDPAHGTVDATTPPRTPPPEGSNDNSQLPSYAQSPAAEKRKRMEMLAAARKRKKHY